MLLSIDLGNSTASVGVFYKKKLLKARCFFYDQFPNNITNWIKSGRFSVNSALIASVNPIFKAILTAKLKAFIPKKALFTLKNAQVPIKNRYRDKAQVGIDRLVNVYGGGKLYGFPCLVIDIGTAVTFDFGSPSGSFEGGLIFPGPYLSVQSLQKGTAQIGSFNVKDFLNPALIGRSTKECVIYGASLVYSLMIPSIIEEYRRYVRRKWKRSLNVIITGGFTHVIKPHLSRDDHKDEFLTLKALAQIYYSRFAKEGGPR